ncbi:MAG: hypothetical protein KAW45_00095 [Thermoplasmatales archaeon]|nr:hypothetical protein [Thermoplasmatales archaeon]
MKKQLLIVGITLVLLAVGLSGCNEKSTDTATTLVQFVKDDIANTLTVDATTSSDILWSDIYFDGNCDTRGLGLGTYVVVGDVIPHCYGTITIYYMPEEVKEIVLDVFEFSSEPRPSIACVEDNSARTLTVVSAFPYDLLWSDLNIIGSCDTSGLNGNIEAGDQITNCSGNIIIVLISTDLILGNWDFT